MYVYIHTYVHIYVYICTNIIIYIHICVCVLKKIYNLVNATAVLPKHLSTFTMIQYNITINNNNNNNKSGVNAF